MADGGAWWPGCGHRRSKVSGRVGCMCLIRRERGPGLVGGVLFVHVAFSCCSYCWSCCRVGKHGARIAPANPTNEEAAPGGKQWGSKWGALPVWLC